MTPVLASRDWRTRAACLDAPLDLFFPEGSADAPAVAAQVAEAKAVCRTCRVTTECLNSAITAREADGVWGGMSEDERAAAHRALTRGTA